MTFEQCFKTLVKQPTLSSREYVFVRHANRQDSYRIFARYITTKTDTTFRKRYEDVLGINLTNGREWQWHHVVERTHLEQLFPRQVSDKLYENEIPTVLIHQATEHIDYNLLHAHGVRSVFDLPAANVALTGPARAQLLNNLKSLYGKVYAHDLVLQTVSSNILQLL